jgi:hypothetical protein
MNTLDFETFMILSIFFILIFLIIAFEEVLGMYHCFLALIFLSRTHVWGFFLGFFFKGTF